MANDEKAREAFRAGLVKARKEIGELLGLESLPRLMREDMLDILERIDDVLGKETEEERDASVDAAIEGMDW